MHKKPRKWKFCRTSQFRYGTSSRLSVVVLWCSTWAEEHREFWLLSRRDWWGMTQLLITTVSGCHWGTRAPRLHHFRAWTQGTNSPWLWQARAQNVQFSDQGISLRSISHMPLPFWALLPNSSLPSSLAALWFFIYSSAFSFTFWDADTGFSDMQCLFLWSLNVWKALWSSTPLYDSSALAKQLHSCCSDPRLYGHDAGYFFLWFRINSPSHPNFMELRDGEISKFLLHDVSVLL